MRPPPVGGPLVVLREVGSAGGTRRSTTETRRPPGRGRSQRGGRCCRPETAICPGGHAEGTDRARDAQGVLHPIRYPVLLHGGREAGKVVPEAPVAQEWPTRRQLLQRHGGRLHPLCRCRLRSLGRLLDCDSDASLTVASVPAQAQRHIS